MKSASILLIAALASLAFACSSGAALATHAPEAAAPATETPATEPPTAAVPAGKEAAPAAAALTPADKLLAAIERIDTGSPSGSSCVMATLAGKVVYFDPVDLEMREGKVWPKADAIFFTHSHGDHFSVATALALAKEDTVIVVPADSAYLLEDAGLLRVLTAVPPGSETEGAAEGGLFGGALRFRTVPMYMEPAADGRLSVMEHPRIMEWVGYVVEAEGATLWYSGDSGETPEVRALRGVDVAIAVVADGFALSVAEAADLMATMKPRYLVPLHYTEDYAGEVAKLPAMMPAGTACVLMGME